MVNKLEAEPLTTTVRDPATGKDLEVVLDGGALIDWLRNQNYGVPMLQAAPDRIDGLAAGRPDAIEAITLDRVSRAPPPGPDVPALGYGLALGVSCREDYPFATPEDLAAAGREAFPDYPLSVTREGVGGWAYFNEDCREVWKVPAAPEAMHQPVASSLPTLLISGSFDTLTSLAGAKAAAAKLSHATIISIPGIGHVRLARVSLRSDGDRLVPRRSRRPRHILRRRAEAAELHLAGFALKLSKHGSRAYAELFGSSDQSPNRGIAR